jgi:hypothetical protein
MFVLENNGANMKYRMIYMIIENKMDDDLTKFP